MLKSGLSELSWFVGYMGVKGCLDISTESLRNIDSLINSLEDISRSLISGITSEGLCVVWMQKNFFLGNLTMDHKASAGIRFKQVEWS